MRYTLLHMSRNTNLLVISGPTSSGKTSLALDIAKYLGISIISADSRQIYKYFDIGTGKVPITNSYLYERHLDYWLIDGVKVYGYDLVEPDKKYNAYDFSIYARNLITQLTRYDGKALLVGGTGFYIDTTLGRLELNQAPSDPTLREELNGKSLENLVLQLKELSIDAYNNIDLKNKVRVVRAIEK